MPFLLNPYIFQPMLFPYKNDSGVHVLMVSFYFLLWSILRVISLAHFNVKTNEMKVPQKAITAVDDI